MLRFNFPFSAAGFRDLRTYSYVGVYVSPFRASILFCCGVVCVACRAVLDR